MISEDIRLKQLDTLVEMFGNGKKAELARKLGITDARIGMWYTRKFIDVVLVADKMPQISAEWLLRGNGEPVETGNTPEEEQEQPEATFFGENVNFTTISLKEENKRLVDETERLREDIKGLREDIAKIREERDTMFQKLMEKV